MRRRILAGTVVLAAAIAVAVWLLAGSDTRRPEYATATGAVLGTCHADPANPPHKFRGQFGPPGTLVAIHFDTETSIIAWTAPGDNLNAPDLALAEQSGDGKWTVTTCDWHFTLDGH
jgi:hypothetical protein